MIAAQAIYRKLRITISKKKIERQLRYQIQTIRPIICPEHTKRGLAKAAIGTSTSDHASRKKVSNAINNPKNNPIDRKRKQDEVRAAHESEFSKSKYLDEVYLGIEGAERKADSIVQANEWFKSTDFLKIMVASNLSSFKLSAYAISIVSFYIFFTSRDATITGTEFAAFLGSRGGHFYDKKGVEHFKPGRPVVLRHTKKSHLYRHESKSDGSIITRNQMINDLGFKVVTLFTSSIKINARDVEDALQLRFQGLPLGCRLWRSPDKGAKFALGWHCLF